MKPRKLAAALVMLLLISTFARAQLDVTIGHHTWAADGLPQIGPGEQVTVFVCEPNISFKKDKLSLDYQTQREAEDTKVLGNWPCSLLRCLETFTGSTLGSKELIDAILPAPKDKNKIHSGKCQHKGIVGEVELTHSVGWIGPKGDNNKIFFLAKNKPTRALAIKQLTDAGFPVEKGTLVIDYWREAYDSNIVNDKYWSE